jgi:hypothetical protein
MDLPDTSLNINGQPLTPDNVLAHAFMFAKEAFDESCEISFIAQSGMDSQGAIRDSENYGLCANVMMESMRQTTKIIEVCHVFLCMLHKINDLLAAHSCSEIRIALRFATITC